MKHSKVTKGLNFDHLALESSNPEKLANFYSSALKMQVKRISDGEWRCEGARRKLIFFLGKKNKIAFFGMAFEHLEQLNDFRERVLSHGLKLYKSPSPYFDEKAFALRDPDDHLIVLGTRKEQLQGAQTILEINVAPLQHLTLASFNVEKFQDFYCNTLGFKITDRVLQKDGSLATCFVTSNNEHHTIACFKSNRVGIDHHSYETGEWNNIRDWCDHFSKLNIPVIWGPGRHGPGNNLFVFIEDPEKNWIEISAELELIQNRDFNDWPQEEKTLNLWGKAIMRS